MIRRFGINKGGAFATHFGMLCLHYKVNDGSEAQKCLECSTISKRNFEGTTEPTIYKNIIIYCSSVASSI